MSDERSFRVLTGLAAQIGVGEEPIEQAVKPDSLHNRLGISDRGLRRYFMPDVERCDDFSIFFNNSLAHLADLQVCRYLLDLHPRENPEHELNQCILGRLTHRTCYHRKVPW